MSVASKQEIGRILEEVGQCADKDIHLTDAALAMAALESPGISLERYHHHIQKMTDEVAARYKELLAEGAEDDAATQLAALKFVVVDTYSYTGDSETYDDLQNVNLIRVIERRKGMPISLSLIYIHLGLEQGWEIAALNFPAHVVCRIEKAGQRLLFDPFNGCRIMQAADLRKLLKTLVSPSAELSSSYYEPSSKRDVLIRMQNNIKLRQIEGEDYLGAVKTVEMMRQIDPKEYRLLLDAGVLYARTHQPQKAIVVLEEYIDLAPSQTDRQDALLLLQEIRAYLN